MEFVLIRHTRCDVAAGTCYGRLDVPLAQSSAADIVQTLAQTPPVGAIFASPLRRCRELAQALANRDACDVRFLPELMELDFGEWEGKRWDDIPRAQSDPWAEDPWRLAPPRGESENELWARAQRAALEIFAAAKGRTVQTSRSGERVAAGRHARARHGAGQHARRGRAADTLGPDGPTTHRHREPRRPIATPALPAHRRTHRGSLARAHRMRRCRAHRVHFGIPAHCPTRISFPVFGSLNT